MKLMSEITGREPRLGGSEPEISGDEPMLGGEKRQTEYCTIRIGDDVWPMLIRKDVPPGFSGMYIGLEGIVIYDKGRIVGRFR